MRDPPWPPWPRHFPLGPTFNFGTNFNMRVGGTNIQTIAVTQSIYRFKYSLRARATFVSCVESQRFIFIFLYHKKASFLKTFLGIESCQRHFWWCWAWLKSCADTLDLWSQSIGYMEFLNLISRLPTTYFYDLKITILTVNHFLWHGEKRSSHEFSAQISW